MRNVDDTRLLFSKMKDYLIDRKQPIEPIVNLKKLTTTDAFLPFLHSPELKKYLYPSLGLELSDKDIEQIGDRLQFRNNFWRILDTTFSTQLGEYVDMLIDNDLYRSEKVTSEDPDVMVEREFMITDRELTRSEKTPSITSVRKVLLVDDSITTTLLNPILYKGHQGTIDVVEAISNCPENLSCKFYLVKLLTKKQTSGVANRIENWLTKVDINPAGHVVILIEITNKQGDNTFYSFGLTSPQYGKSFIATPDNTFENKFFDQLEKDPDFNKSAFFEVFTTGELTQSHLVKLRNTLNLLDTIYFFRDFQFSQGEPTFMESDNQMLITGKDFQYKRVIITQNKQECTLNKPWNCTTFVNYIFGEDISCTCKRAPVIHPTCCNAKMNDDNDKHETIFTKIGNRIRGVKPKYYVPQIGKQSVEARIDDIFQFLCTNDRKFRKQFCK